MTIEEKAREFSLTENGGLSEFYIATHFKELLVKFAMQIIKENGIQWHDLRKDPNDLPKEIRTVLDEAGDRFYYFRGHFYYENDLRFDCQPIAWCEIPQFEE